MRLADGRVHFVGVGGAGMSAIAKVLLERGVAVSGSDLKRSRAFSSLEAMGAEIHIGHDAALVDDANVVVVSSAIPATNAEVVRARELEIEVVPRGRALAELLSHGRAVVVAGTHGKTTTTSMIVSICHRAGLDPTYLVGAGLNEVGTNARWGHSPLTVAESDESDGSFLMLSPHVGVVTNVDADHLDYWPSLDAIKEAFGKWLSNIDPLGAAVLPVAEADLVGRARAAGRRVVTFGDGGDVRATHVDCRIEGSCLVWERGRDRVDVALRVPGRHNVANALAAGAAAAEVGIGLADIAAGLSAYRGVERRMQVRGTARGVTVIDDYAHHPTEVAAVLSAVAPGGWRRVVAVFQPHLYSRTAALSDAFGGAFAGADHIVVTDVYGAREQPVPGVTGKLVADAACSSLPGRRVAYLPRREELLDYLYGDLRPGDALLTLGAGDITSIGEELLERMGGSAA
jgi:UDP-N-acetylmuramate--alanine ligase